MARGKLRTIVYVDGFNLYYGALRERFPEYKWLDVRKLAGTLFRECSIERVRYFTARVTARPSDPDQPQRQQAYLRALEASGVELHFGLFQSRPRKMQRTSVCPRPDCPSSERVEVLYTEEKGSDVALASYLLRDGFVEDIDMAIVVTNDTDLIAPLRIARSEAGVQVALVSPSKYAHRDLRAEADSVKSLRRGALSASQFPRVLRDAIGPIHCPPTWLNRAP
jgi:uncharacterized LabA/DUF88 family protein